MAKMSGTANGRTNGGTGPKPQAAPHRAATRLAPPEAGARATPGQGTPLRIPFGNKEAAQRLGAHYGAGGWYAPVGVDIGPFRERDWL